MAQGFSTSQHWQATQVGSRRLKVLADPTRLGIRGSLRDAGLVRAIEVDR